MIKKLIPLCSYIQRVLIAVTRKEATLLDMEKIIHFLPSSADTPIHQQQGLYVLYGCMGYTPLYGCPNPTGSCLKMHSKTWCEVNNIYLREVRNVKCEMRNVKFARSVTLFHIFVLNIFAFRIFAFSWLAMNQAPDSHEYHHDISKCTSHDVWNCSQNKGLQMNYDLSRSFSVN